MPTFAPPELCPIHSDLPLFIENSCFFIFTPELMRERGNRIGARPHMFEMSALEAVDIDTEEDFALASAIAMGNPINT